MSCFRIELRALGKISEGEELTVSYIDFLHLSEERRQQLKKQYYFDCSCEHCQKGLKDDLFLAVKEDPKVHTTLLQGLWARVGVIALRNRVGWRKERGRQVLSDLGTFEEASLSLKGQQ